MGYIFDAINQFDDGDGPDANRPRHGTHDHQPATPQGIRPASKQDPGTKAVGAESATVPGPTGVAPTGLGPGSDSGLTDTGTFKIIPPPDLVDVESLVLDDRLVAVSEPSSVMAEEYRSIRTGMLARWEQKRHLVHTITSATPQEGKTITTLNLGFIFAELRNRRVAILEADLRLPLFDKMLSFPRSPGLVGLLEEKATLSQAVHRLADDRLHVITAGKRVNNKSAVQLLSSSAMVSLIQKLRTEYDHVIVDTPPVIELADAGITGTMSDEVLLIARMNRTPRSLVEQAIRTLTSYGASVGGVIATDQQRPRKRYYYYKYGYKYGSNYAHDTSDPSKKAA